MYQFQFAEDLDEEIKLNNDYTAAQTPAMIFSSN